MSRLSRSRLDKHNGLMSTAMQLQLFMVQAVNYSSFLMESNFIWHLAVELFQK